MRRMSYLLCLVLSVSLGCGAAKTAPPVSVDEVQQSDAEPTVSEEPIAESSVQPLDVDPSILAEEVPRETEPLPVNFGKIKFKAADGQVSYSIKPREDGAKLVDGKEQEMARYNLSAGKLKIKDPDDVTLAYIIFADPHFHIEDAEQKERLWKLQRQDDGDWKLEQRNETLVYKLKKRDYGFEVEDAKENSLYKAKLKGEKTSLRDASDSTVISTKDKVNTLSVACLGLDAIKDQRVRIGLAIATQLQVGDGS